MQTFNFPVFIFSYLSLCNQPANLFESGPSISCRLRKTRLDTRSILELEWLIIAEYANSLQSAITHQIPQCVAHCAERCYFVEEVRNVPRQWMVQEVRWWLRYLSDEPKSELKGVGHHV